MARAALRWVGLNTDRRSQWIRQLSERRGKNRTAVAVANKNARIVWALLTSHEAYEPAKGSSQRRSGCASSPRSTKGGGVTATMDVKPRHQSFAGEVKGTVFPHNARCDRVDGTIGQTSFLKPCTGTGPVRPRS